MCKKIVFFQPMVNGHYLEYLHHEYLEAARWDKYKFFFVVPSEFSDKKEMLEWPSASNIQFVYLTSDEERKCRTGSRYKQAFYQSKISGKYAKELEAGAMFFNSLINAMPFLPFFLPKRCKVSGIIYNNFLWEKRSGFKLKNILNDILYLIFAHSKAFCSVFLLNDKMSADKLNERFHANRYKYLPDPIPDIDMTQIKNVRCDYGISKSDVVYLQLGIQSRKHVIDIFKAINIASKDVLRDKVFVFTGVFSDDIEAEYRDWLEKLRGKAHIIDLSGRIPFLDLYNLFSISDFCFALYDNTNMSSGVIGYSALFNSQIIGPANGLLGYLIQNNNLGVVLDEINPDTIMSTFSMQPFKTEQNYHSDHTVKAFNECLFAELL